MPGSSSAARRAWGSTRSRSCTLTHSGSDAALLDAMNLPVNDADFPRRLMIVEPFGELLRPPDRKRNQREAKPNNETQSEHLLRRALPSRFWLRHLVHENLRDPQNRITPTAALLNL